MKHTRIISLLKRILAMLVVVFITLTATFFIMHTIKGDPFLSHIEDLSPQARQRYITEYGLDKPLLQQYGIFLKNLLHGDLGVSFRNRTSTVTDVIQNSLPASLITGGIALIIGTVIGYLLGVWAAYEKKSWLKSCITTISMLGISLPIFIVAPVMQNIFALRLKLLPVSGWSSYSNLVLPVICMLPLTIATIMKYTKNSIEKVRASGYYIAAKQRGFSEFYIFKKHIFRNSSSALLTVLVSSVSGIFTGSFIVEKIFAIPGIGSQFVYAINTRDYPIIIGLNIVFTGIYVTCILVGDILQEILYPQFKDSLL